MRGFDDFILSKIFFNSLKSYEYKNNSTTHIKKKIYYANSQSVVFILPHWMGKTFYYNPLINKLRNKYTIVLYDLPYQLLSDDIELMVYLHKKIMNDMKSTFDKLQRIGCESYSIIGTSGSTPVAAMVANSDDRCKKLVLNLVGNELAECIWHSKNPLLIAIKNNLIKGNVTLDKLKKYLRIMSYKQNSRNLKNKDILIFLSKNDKIIPYNNGLKLLRRLDSDGIKYQLKINTFFGHYILGFKNVVFHNKIIKFLENQ